MEAIKEAIKSDDAHKLHKLMSTGIDVVRCDLGVGIIKVL